MLKVQNRVLSILEIRQVVKYHKTGGRRLNRPAVQLRFAIFRLSCCAGLRCCEIAGLNLGDFYFDVPRPYIRIRKEITKGYRRPGAEAATRKERHVGIWVDDETVEDLKRWYQFRLLQSGGDMNAPFICGQTLKNTGERLGLKQVSRLWKTALRTLGKQRARLGIHSGRHTCLSHLVLNYPLPFVRDYAGHRSIATTSLYLHSFDEDTFSTSAFQV